MSAEMACPHCAASMQGAAIPAEHLTHKLDHDEQLVKYGSCYCLPYGSNSTHFSRVIGRETRERRRIVSDFTVTNAEGVAAVHEARRNRKRQRDLGLCCRPGDLCETCELEAEAKYADD